MKFRDIIAVQYESKMMPGEFGGKPYNYFTAVPLKVGDVVNVPTQRGTSLARVARVGIEEHRVSPDIRKIMRTITEAPVKAPEHKPDPVQESFFGR